MESVDTIFGLPRALPDELLYSRMVRGITIGGFTRSEFLNRLFGASRISVHPYLTIGADRVAYSDGVRVGEVLSQQTLTPLFAELLPKYRDNIYKAYFECDSTRLIRAVQIPCFRGHKALCLRYCIRCVDDDIREHGVSYWHLAHQIPGVEACYKHQIFLNELEVSGRYSLRAGFLPMSSQTPRQHTELAAEFARFAIMLRASIKTDTESYSAKLRHLGFVTKNGRVRRQSLCRSLYLLSAELGHTDTTYLPSSDKDFGYPSKLLDSKISQHPARHIFFRFWMERALPNELFTKKILEVSDRYDDLQTNRCLQLLRRGFSLSDVSRRTRKSYCFLKRLASIHSIIVTESISAERSQAAAVISKLAWKGFHRRAIASVVGFSLGTVEQRISCEPGLVEHRKRCKFESRRRRYKATLLRGVSKHTDINRTEIRGIYQKEYGWLYLHEKEWLFKTLPKPIPASGTHPIYDL